MAKYQPVTIRLILECSDDYKRAVRLATSFMKKMAMNERVSLISADEKNMSNRYNAMLENEASLLLNQFLQEATSLVKSNKDIIDKLATELLKKETLDLKQIRLLLNLPDTKNTST